MNSEKPSSWILAACLLLGMVLENLIVSSQDATSLDQGLRDLAADELDPSALQFKAQAHFAAGVSFLAQGEKDKALEQFEKALQVDPESASLATRMQKISFCFSSSRRLNLSYSVPVSRTMPQEWPLNFWV